MDSKIKRKQSKMKALIVLLGIMLYCSSSFGQDGSNMRYIEKIDQSLIGDTIHLDFYRRSYHGLNIDTISINVNGKGQRFFEIRKDNGFNNWFFEQGLESVNDIDGYKVRIAGWKVLEVSKDSITVLPNTQLIFPKETLVTDFLVIDKCTFPKSIIAEVLVKAD